MVARVLIVAVCCLPALGADFGGLYPHPVTLFDFGGIGGLVSADFNDDGKLDLAFGLLQEDELVILLGRGDGSHRRAATYPVPSPAFLAVGDFNQDGNEDLVITNFDEGSISILNGTGDGSFAAGGSYGSLADQPWRVAVGDFDENEMLDVLVASPGGNVLFPGNGDGTFGAEIAAPGASTSVVIADFNEDGLDDFAEPTLLLLGDGAFGFTIGNELLPAVGNGASQVAAADLDADGDLDLAVVEMDTLSIFRGSGDGTFLLEEAHDSPAVSHVMVMQADGDAVPDLITTCAWHPCEYGMSVLRGLGSGQFAEAVHVETGDLQVYTTVAGDFNHDGRQDVALGDFTNTRTGVVLGLGDGTFETPFRLADWSVTELAILDLDDDGRVDILRQGWEISLGRATGAGTFQIDPIGCGPSDAFVVGEMNGDGLADVALFRSVTDSLTLCEGDGQGGFTPDEAIFVDNPMLIESGDLNDDQIDDLVVLSASVFVDQLHVLLGRDEPGFDAMPPAAVPGDSSAMALGQLDGDGKLDLAMAMEDGGLFTRMGHGNGTFAPPTAVDAVDDACGLALQDLDGDSHVDLAVASTSNDTVQIMRGAGDGSFVVTDVLATRVGLACTLSFADLDGDGRLDLMLEAGSGSTLFRGNGDATFGEGHDIIAPYDLAAGDFDLDGQVDLVTGIGTLLFNLNGPDVLSFLSDGATLSWPSTIGAQSYAVYRGLLSELPGGHYGSCISTLDDDDRDTFFVDTELPAAGTGFFYLVDVGTCP